MGILFLTSLYTKVITSYGEMSIGGDTLVCQTPPQATDKSLWLRAGSVPSRLFRRNPAVAKVVIRGRGRPGKSCRRVGSGRSQKIRFPRVVDRTVSRARGDHRGNLTPRSGCVSHLHAVRGQARSSRRLDAAPYPSFQNDSAKFHQPRRLAALERSQHQPHAGALEDVRQKGASAPAVHAGQSHGKGETDSDWQLAHGRAGAHRHRAQKTFRCGGHAVAGRRPLAIAFATRVRNRGQ